jgi:metal-sulfur cluster biosynthetic enzyme
MASLQEIEEALTNVIDPELGLDFVELGLIYGIQQDSGNVHVTFTLTTPACPIGPQITEQIEEFVAPLEGVNSVKSSMIFEPAWSPEKMSEDAKFARFLRARGCRVIQAASRPRSMVHTVGQRWCRPDSFWRSDGSFWCCWSRSA